MTGIGQPSVGANPHRLSATARRRNNLVGTDGIGLSARAGSLVDLNIWCWGHLVLGASVRCDFSASCSAVVGAVDSVIAKDVAEFMQEAAVFARPHRLVRNLCRGSDGSRLRART